MVAEIKRRNLGKGLSALLGEASDDYAKLDRVRSPKSVPTELLRPGAFQPRHRMAEQDLEDLAKSVTEKGILQPILVRRHADEPEAFEIIAGERRWRAAQLAQLHEVPVIIKDLSDREAMEIALVENLQRQDLSALEEAEGYRRLMEEFTHTQEDLARSVGKSRSHVANMMRLLSLPEPVKKMLDDGELSAGHARALLGAADVAALARQVVKRGLNVRQTERLATAEGRSTKKRSKTMEKDVDTIALERDLSNLLGLSVEVKLRADGGTLTLHYRSLDQLDDILHRLSHGTRGGLSDVPGAYQTFPNHTPPGNE
jgi:ParB family chromosome partitioning protein